MSQTLSVAKQVFYEVARHGALSVRRLEQTYGDPAQWQIALRTRYLTQQQTVYGPVLTLGPEARRTAGTAAVDFTIPYIAGPSSAADRAYQMDAVQHLEREGYSVARHIYKRAGAVGEAARRGRRTTDQIVATVMRLPEEQLRPLEARFLRSDRAYRPGADGLYPERPGYPHLYATISHGGIRLPRLRKLLDKHKQHRTMYWHSPLLIAVPEEGNLRAYLRQLDARETELYARATQRSGEWRTVARLIILPLP